MPEHHERAPGGRESGSVVAAAQRVRQRSADSREGRPGEGLLALQRSAGNGAVQRALRQRSAEPTIALQRATSASPERAAADAQEDISSEVEFLRGYQQQTQDPEVQRLLAELMPLLDQVKKFTATSAQSGGNTRPYGEPGQYAIEYAGASDVASRIATLVHELTHVAVNEAYDSDMLNYPVPPLSAEELEADGASEESRQLARRRKMSKGDIDAFELHVMKSAVDLLQLLPGSGLSEERQEEAREKLRNHTAPKPFHEYDGVLSQLLVWCDQAGPNARSSPFYARTSELVRQAAGWRSERRVTPDDVQGATFEGLSKELYPGSGPSSGGGAGAAPTTGSKRQSLKKALGKIGKRFH